MQNSRIKLGKGKNGVYSHCETGNMRGRNASAYDERTYNIKLLLQHSQQEISYATEQVYSSSAGSKTMFCSSLPWFVGWETHTPVILSQLGESTF